MAKEKKIGIQGLLYGVGAGISITGLFITRVEYFGEMERGPMRTCLGVPAVIFLYLLLNSKKKNFFSFNNYNKKLI